MPPPREYIDDVKNLTVQRTEEVKQRGRKRKTVPIVVDRAARRRQRVLDIDDDAGGGLSIIKSNYDGSGVRTLHQT